MRTAELNRAQQRRLVGAVVLSTAGIVLTGLVVIGVRHADRHVPGQAMATERGPVTATVNPGVTALNVRAVSNGTDAVDLRPAAVIGTLGPGDPVRVVCEFADTGRPDGGSDWYRITGLNVPDTAMGSTAVAYAGYLTVAGPATVPSCAGTDHGTGTLVRAPK